MKITRRRVLKVMGTAPAAAILPASIYAAKQNEPMPMIRIETISPTTFRLSILPIADGKPMEIPDRGFLVAGLKGHTALETQSGSHEFKSGELHLNCDADSLAVSVFSAGNELVQKLQLDQGALTFLAGTGPMLGGGEGGAQFDRRGRIDRMISGSGGYDLERHGSRVPIPWLIGTEGWAIFFHQPLGTFDLRDSTARFRPAQSGLLDVFVVVSKDPKTIMAEYARLTGKPELPPLWSLGYLQSHRTLGDPASILKEANTFREKRLPCEAMIYLGTGFCPNGWNVRNGSFEWNARVFPDPPAAIKDLHAAHFKVIPHVVIEARTFRGTVHDAVGAGPEEASAYWPMHRPDFSMGIDGWWPDEGDWLDMPARLARNRMYWEGPQIDRPNERPFALHRNGAPGMQRYASFLWSGDVYSHWETLRNQVPIGINTGLSGIPYWGTDIGGFVPTPEFTAELYVRWFQFGAFCPLFRCHGRNWTLRLPWGWDTGDSGPQEVRDYRGSGLPDASQLHNAAVEPICRKYLELRSRLMPYLYSVARESTQTGLPIMRALWLHYPELASVGDVYLWGRDILVAPVTEKGATSRTVYLPPGAWHDFWTNEVVRGGREITRPVDLETIPLYVRAGAILPMGPVRQYVSAPVSGPLELHVYPGADGAFEVYEDDGESFDYRRGDWGGIVATWNDISRTLHLQAAKGSKGSRLRGREMAVHVGDQVHTVKFEGRPVLVKI